MKIETETTVILRLDPADRIRIYHLLIRATDDAGNHRLSEEDIAFGEQLCKALSKLPPYQ